jgi:hypothetical protein
MLELPAVLVALMSALPITVASIAVLSIAVPSTAVLSIAVPPMAHIAVTVPASPRVSARQQRVPQRPVQQRQARITTLLAAILRTRPASREAQAFAAALIGDVASSRTTIRPSRSKVSASNDRWMIAVADVVVVERDARPRPAQQLAQRSRCSIGSRRKSLPSSFDAALMGTL